MNQEYLENDVTDGLNHVEEKTIQLTDEANSIIESVQDLVAIEKFDESNVIESIQHGKIRSNDIIEELHALDDSQVRALEPVLDRVITMKNYVSELDSKFKSADLSVSSYDVNVIKDMKTYDKVIAPFFNADTDQLKTEFTYMKPSETIMEVEQKN